PLDVAQLAHRLPEHRPEFFRATDSRNQHADRRHLRLLRARRERPQGHRPAEKCEEVPPSHSMTSSAKARSDCGIVSPSDCAVLRLTTKSNFTGSWIGRSPGLAPLRMRST